MKIGIVFTINEQEWSDELAWQVIRAVNEKLDDLPLGEFFHNGRWSYPRLHATDAGPIRITGIKPHDVNQ